MEQYIPTASSWTFARCAQEEVLVAGVRDEGAKEAQHLSLFVKSHRRVVLVHAD